MKEDPPHPLCHLCVLYNCAKDKPEKSGAEIILEGIVDVWDKAKPIATYTAMGELSYLKPYIKHAKELLGREPSDRD